MHKPYHLMTEEEQQNFRTGLMIQMGVYNGRIEAIRADGNLQGKIHNWLINELTPPQE